MEPSFVCGDRMSPFRPLANVQHRLPARQTGHSKVIGISARMGPVNEHDVIAGAVAT